MTATITAPGIYADIPEVEYHADRTSLSSTGAKTLTRKTPAEFRWEQSNPVYKKEYDFGSLVHRLALGAGPDIVIIDAADWRTKAAKEQRDEAREAGKIPVLEKEWRRAERVIEALHSSDTAMEYLTGGQPEMSLYWNTDVELGDGWDTQQVRRRGRVDYLKPNAATDLKTAADASPAGFGKAVANFNYFQQEPWYLDGLQANGHQVDDDGFMFVVISIEPPYMPAVYRLAPTAVEHGRELNRRAMRTYAECTRTGIWPGYGERIHTIDLPTWAYTDLEPLS